MIAEIVVAPAKGIHLDSWPNDSGDFLVFHDLEG